MYGFRTAASIFRPVLGFSYQLRPDSDSQSKRNLLYTQAVAAIHDDIVYGEVNFVTPTPSERELILSDDAQLPEIPDTVPEEIHDPLDDRSPKEPLPLDRP